jgi:hypothetical protein
MKMCNIAGLAIRASRSVIRVKIAKTAVEGLELVRKHTKQALSKKQRVEVDLILRHKHTNN